MAKGTKILLWVISISLMVFLLNIFLNNTIRSKIEKQLTEEFDLDFSNVSTSIWNRAIIIDSIFNKVSNGSLKRLKVSKINWLDLVRSRKLNLNDVSLSISEISYPLSGGIQHFKIDSLSKVGENISLYNVEYASPYSIDRYMSMLERRKPYISLKFPSLNLSQVSVKNRYIGLMQADSFVCTVSEDLNIPANHIKKKLLAQIIKDIKEKFLIDSMDLKNGKLAYSLKDEGSDDSGFIEFNDIHIQGQNLTNDSAAIAENSEMVVELSAKIQNVAPLHVVTKHFLGKDNYHYDLFAKLTNLNLEHGNDILRSSKGIIIENGKINSVEINGSFYDDRSEGEVKIDYKELKIDLNRKYSGILNFIGNLVINNKKVDSETFELNRNKEKSFMIHIWQSMISALRKIILVV